MAEELEATGQSREIDDSRLKWAVGDLRDFAAEYIGEGSFITVSADQLRTWQAAAKDVLQVMSDEVVPKELLQAVEEENSGLYDRIEQIIAERDTERTAHDEEVKRLTEQTDELEAANSTANETISRGVKVVSDLVQALDQVKPLGRVSESPWVTEQRAVEEFLKPYIDKPSTQEEGSGSSD